MHEMDVHELWLHELARSNSESTTQWWERVHREAFTSFRSCEAVEDLEQQKLGIDRLVHTAHRVVSVEEKLDHTLYPNIAFEVESTAGYSKGWARKPINADLLAYGFRKANVVFYFQPSELLSVFDQRYDAWKRQYGERTVWSSNAIVLPVPIDVVMNSVTCCREVRLAAPARIPGDVPKGGIG